MTTKKTELRECPNCLEMISLHSKECEICMQKFCLNCYDPIRFGNEFCKTCEPQEITDAEHENEYRKELMNNRF